MHLGLGQADDAFDLYDVSSDHISFTTAAASNIMMRYHLPSPLVRSSFLARTGLFSDEIARLAMPTVLRRSVAHLIPVQLYLGAYQSLISFSSLS